MVLPGSDAVQSNGLSPRVMTLVLDRDADALAALEADLGVRGIAVNVGDREALAAAWSVSR